MKYTVTLMDTADGSTDTAVIEVAESVSAIEAAEQYCEEQNAKGEAFYLVNNIERGGE